MAALVTAAAGLAIGAPAGAQLSLEVVTTNVSSPMLVTGPAGDDRLFIVERLGRIVIFDPVQGAVTSTYLDIQTQVDAEGEGGLLGVAFSPTYATDGFVYVHYTADASGTCNYPATCGGFPVTCPLETRVSRFTAIGDPAVATAADAGTEWILFREDQPFSNHNAGSIAFRDGLLYLALGDGGLGDDCLELAQDDSSNHGKMLRFDLSGVGPNPQGVLAPEQYAKGLRNPFRWGFDALTGDLHIGDVGQGRREEVNFVADDTPAGINFGWDIIEGTACFEGTPQECADPALTPPVHDYPRLNPCRSVTGGSVYRGSRIPSADGLYFFADFCSNEIWTLEWDPVQGLLAPPASRTSELVPPSGGGLQQIVAISEDGLGELYVVELTGRVTRVVPEPRPGWLAAGALVALTGLRARTRRPPAL